MMLALFAGGGALAAERGGELTVVSVNAWGLPAPLSADRPQRLERLAAWLGGLDADVAGLQEVWNGAVPLLPMVVQRSARGGDDGLAFSSARGLREVETRRFERARSFDAFKQKGVLRGRLERAEGPDVWVFVTHLQSGYGAANARVREHQLEQVLSWVAATSGPCVVLGDFNVDERHPEDQPFLERLKVSGLRDAVAALGVTAGTYPGDGRRYDRIYTVDRAGWRFLSVEAEVVAYDDDPESRAPQRLSDHRPVWARLRLVGDAR